MSHTSYEVITYGRVSYLAWNSKPEDERYYGVKIQRAVSGNNWETVAEYPRSNDPGRFDMIPGQVYRVVSLWNINQKFYSARFSEGTYVQGRVSEVIEEGYFSANSTAEVPGFNTITIEDHVEVDIIGAQVVAPTITAFDNLFISTLSTLTPTDTSFSPAPGAIVLNEQFTNFDIFLPVLAVIYQEDTSFSPAPGAILFDGALSIEKVNSGSVINIG